VESGSCENNWHCLSTEGAIPKPLHPAVAQHFALQAASISAAPSASLTTKKPRPLGEWPALPCAGPAPLAAKQYPDLGALKESLHAVVVEVVVVVLVVVAALLLLSSCCFT
jgi:hypothetical protein